MVVENLLHDIQARMQALDVTKSFIVQAPAGSGKTGLLTQRFLALLSTVNEPEECLAITFTRKAQAEMQNRIVETLVSAKNQEQIVDPYQKVSRELANKVLAQSARRGWDLLDNYKRLKIKTIDALCMGITNMMPVVSRFGGHTDVAVDASACYALATERVLNAIELPVNHRAALNTLLLHLDNNMQKVAELFMSMLPLREQWLPYLLHAQNDSAAAREFFTTGIGQLAEEVLASVVNSLPLEFEQLPRIAMAAGGYLRGSSQQQHSPTGIAILADYSAWPCVEAAELPAWLAWAELLLTSNNAWRKRLTAAQGFPANTEFKNKTEREFYQLQKQSMLEALAKLSVNDKLLANLTWLRQFAPLVDATRNGMSNIGYIPKKIICAGYTDAQWELIQGLTVILPYLVAQLVLVFKETGQTDFNEINIAASSALGRLDEPSELALAMDYKLKHILVDEFQDTSLAQFRLLEQLVNGWEQGDGRTLFLVGDPMQSIYRFRQAEVGLFLQAARCGIGSVNLTSLQLCTNFRSSSELVCWYNTIFTQIFPPASDASCGAVRYELATAKQNEESSNSDFAGHDALTNVKVTCNYGELNRDVDIDAERFQVPAEFTLCSASGSAAEARTIVKLISNIKRQFPNDSIAILVRAKNHLAQIIAELKQHNQEQQEDLISYSGIEIENLMSSSNVKDLLALTQAILHIGDRVAWLAVLRAPWCGLQLMELHTLFAVKHHECIWEALLAYKYTTNKVNVGNNLSMDARVRLLHVTSILELAMADKDKLPLSVLVRRTRRLLLGDNCKVDTESAEFFRLLQQFEDEPEIKQPGFLQQKLQELFISRSVDNSTAVQLMTIHKAKGLEFDHVVLPGLNRISGKHEDKLLYWEQRKYQHEIRTISSAYLLLAPIKETGKKSDPLGEILRYMDKVKNQHELTRLFYVACTRAKKKLYGFAAMELNKNPAPGSFLALLWGKVDFAVNNENYVLNNSNVAVIHKTLLSRLTVVEVQNLINLNQTIFKTRQIKDNSDDADNITKVGELSSIYSRAKETSSIPKVSQDESELRRQIGILTHWVLAQIASNGVERWQQVPQSYRYKQWNNMLRQAGVVEMHLQQGTELVAQAVFNALADPIGRWLLNDKHKAAKVEWELIHNQDGGNLGNQVDKNQVRKFIIDRSFIDQYGTRWIVDYKVCQQNEFDDNLLLTKYIAQLTKYEEIVKTLEPNQPIKLGIYFPLQTRWHVVE